MTDYNSGDLDRMRSEALRRMREMQRRAEAAGFSPPPQEKSAVPKGNAGGSPHGSAADLRSLLGSVLGGSRPGEGGEGLFRLGGMVIDEEKALIAMLIYILFRQGADVRLLLALGYLLL